MTRRSFSGLRAKEALDLVPVRRTTPWQLETPQRPPTDTLLTMLTRFQQSFGLMSSEAAKVMLIDTVLAEVVSLYRGLKVWKDEPLEGATVGGVTDYLIAPNYGYVETPLLCAVEAKLDDFAAGETQCIAEMAACRDNNSRDGHDIEIHGIVSNGQGWVFLLLDAHPGSLGIWFVHDERFADTSRCPRPCLRGVCREPSALKTAEIRDDQEHYPVAETKPYPTRRRFSRRAAASGGSFARSRRM